MMAELANRPNAIATLEKILDGERAVELPSGVMLVDGRLFLETWKHCAERGYGKVAGETETAEGRKPLLVRMVHSVEKSA